MIKQSHWPWKGSSLDPEWRRPQMNLKRQREKSTSSSKSSNSRDTEDSEQELFPDESQGHLISRRCPGLLTRYAVRGKEEIAHGFRRGHSGFRAQSNFRQVLPPGVCPVLCLDPNETRVPNTCHLPRSYSGRQHFKVPRCGGSANEGSRTNQPRCASVASKSFGTHPPRSFSPSPSLHRGKSGDCGRTSSRRRCAPP